MSLALYERQQEVVGHGHQRRDKTARAAITGQLGDIGHRAIERRAGVHHHLVSQLGQAGQDTRGRECAAASPQWRAIYSSSDR